MIHEVDPEPIDDSDGIELEEGQSGASNLRPWPWKTVAGPEGSGDEIERAAVLHRLAMIAIALAASQILILTGEERLIFCSSCGQKTPVGITPRHKPTCLTAEIIRLVERVRELEPNLKGREDADAGNSGAGDANRSRSTIREPWNYAPGPKPGWFQILDRDGCRRAMVGGRFVDRRETAERIVACVNLAAEE